LLTLGSLLQFPDTGGLAIETDHIFIPAAREELAIYSLGAADGFFIVRSGRGGTVSGPSEPHTHFICVVGLLKGRVGQDADEEQGA
jgi:hypothetical protein